VEHRDGEPLLDGGQVARAEALEQLSVGLVTPQEDVLASVDTELAPLERVRRSAQVGSRLEQDDGDAAISEVESGADPGEATADDSDR
jgi:hypothetical protein